MEQKKKLLTSGAESINVTNTGEPSSMGGVALAAAFDFRARLLDLFDASLLFDDSSVSLTIALPVKSPGLATDCSVGGEDCWDGMFARLARFTSGKPTAVSTAVSSEK